VYCLCSLPPSLLCSASITFRRLIFELEQFELTRETTYDQYVWAVRSCLVPVHQLLPPDFPEICLLFRCNVFAYKLHHHCPGRASWKILMQYTFGSESEAIRSLTCLEHTYWCRHCKRGLFFYPKCLTLPRL
jgi:hypothetical protein